MNDQTRIKQLEASRRVVQRVQADPAMMAWLRKRVEEIRAARVDTRTHKEARR